MKVSFLSNNPTSDIQTLFNMFVSTVSSINSDIHSLKRVFDDINSLDLTIVTASKDNPPTPIFGTKDLKECLDEMAEINRNILRNLKSLEQTRDILKQAVTKSQKLAISITTSLPRAILKARTNASELPEFIKESNSIEHADQVQIQNAQQTTSTIVSNCWKCLRQMNLILDSFPIDRTQDPYKHLPENESEL